MNKTEFETQGNAGVPEGGKDPLFALNPFPRHWHSLAHAFVQQARKNPSAPAMADSSGASLSYNEVLIAAVLMANLLQHELDSNPDYVGILLPPSVAAALTNIALTLLGKVPVNLNYTSGKKVLESCVRQCGIRRIISSKQVVERFELQSLEEILLLESLKTGSSLLARVCSFLEAELIPEELLSSVLPGLSQHRLHKSDSKAYPAEIFHPGQLKARLDDLATIMFTAGSTAEPKPVMLSHRNVLSNIQAIYQVAPKQLEVILGVLPFFHSFGFTVTLWASLCLGLKTVYHYDPFDARKIGKLCQSHKVTAIFCTPTIMRTYLKRCSPEQFSSVQFCVLGGEKLGERLAADIKKNLGLDAYGGYGLAETSPVLTANLPGRIRLPGGREIAASKAGSVGLPLPGTVIRVVSADKVEELSDLPPLQEGMIIAAGPQVMQGYLNMKEASSAAIRDGWFITGDLGHLDHDGFLTITGRASQFTKIAGEMVSHAALERALLSITGATEDCLAVTSVPDNKRGERLAVVHCPLPIAPKEIVQKLRSSNIPRISIPSPDDFIETESLPVLGNGKRNLRRIKEIAEEGAKRQS